MPSLNQARFLPAALASVLEQDYPELELIVADGGSTDGTLEILRDVEARDPRLRWASEPDSGPAQAVNRAMSRVRGTIVGWLNADDLYAPGAIGSAVAALTDKTNLMMVYGQGEHVDESGRLIGRYPTQKPEGPLERFAEGCFICQPTVFFRRTMPLLIGPLDETFMASFDFDYWLRAFGAFPGRIGFVETVLARARLHPGAITSRQRRTVAFEGMRILAGAFGSAPVHWLTTYLEEARAAGGTPKEIEEDASLSLRQASPYLPPAELARVRETLGIGDVRDPAGSPAVPPRPPMPGAQKLAYREGTIFDIGMHDGADTEFYLKKGFSVVAVEANPDLAQQGALRFSDWIAQGRLMIEAVGVDQAPGELNFYVSNNSVYSSFDEKLGSRDGLSQVVKVPTVTMYSLFEKHGVPYFLKVDIEGNDGLTFEALEQTSVRPRYVSVENGFVWMLERFTDLGYDLFKFVNQAQVVHQQLAHPPREGRDTEHAFEFGSSGAFGDEAPGEWLPYDAIRRRIEEHWGTENLDPQVHGWYDLHARLRKGFNRFGM